MDPLAAMKAFYGGTLGLAVVEEETDRITVDAGGTRLTFRTAGALEGDRPFYHFAFNIPENKVLDARSWQLERSDLMPVPARLRDARYPDDVVHFSHWNAHSVFFLDPAGNALEFKAFKDMSKLFAT